jgi:hypothetical protein
MVHFLSNHKDISFLQQYFKGEPITIIPHPVLDPDWSEIEIKEKCQAVIEQAIQADILIANGDYTLVGMILLERSRVDKKTGFLAMKKMSGSDSVRDAEGKITFQNVVKPVGVRWLP